MHKPQPEENDLFYYRPTAFYFRTSLRKALTKEDAVDIGMTAVADLEALRNWAYELGLIPPQRFCLIWEAKAKGMLPVD